LLAVALCTVIWLVFQWIAPPPSEDAAAEVSAAAGDGAAGVADGGAPAEAGTPPPPTTGGGAVAGDGDEVAAAPAVAPARHELASDLLRVDTGNAAQERGALALVRGLGLLGEQFQGHAAATDPLALAGAATLLIDVADADTDFRLPREAAFELVEAGTDRAVYGVTREDVAIRAALELVDGYEARLVVTVENRSAQRQSHRLHVRQRIGAVGTQYDVHRVLCMTGEEGLYDDVQGDLEGEPEQVRTGVVRWTAADSKYYMTALVPQEPAQRCESRFVGAAGDTPALLEIDVVSAEVALEPGTVHTHVYGVYAGAKDIDRLRRFSAVKAEAVDLTDAVNWGFLGFITEGLGLFLLGLLRWLHVQLGSWGWAIIALTVLVKGATLPLTLRQMASMKKMREIQPELAQLKEKYADDRNKQAQEMQALFARAGVNPLAGCLPMLVQLPVWFALYAMLNTAPELVHQQFLWLPDLTAPDVYFVLPLAIGGLMAGQQLVTPSTMDSEQARMMLWLMPTMFTVFMLFLPAGLGVYIFANIALSIVQTWVQVGASPTTPAADAKP
jgi:YidC/Oxa1 family membrane protein insertase